MGMAYFDKINPSIYGRRFGLQSLSSGQSGGSFGRIDVAVGAEALRGRFSTAESTAAIPAYGYSVLQNSSAGSSQVFQLDPPISGVEKTVTFMTTVNTIYLKGLNGETFISSQGSSATTLKSTQLVSATVKLVPVSTAAWMVVGQLSSAFVSATTST